LHVICCQRTITIVMTPVWPTIEAFLPRFLAPFAGPWRRGGGRACGIAPARRDRHAADGGRCLTAAPSPGPAAIILTGTSHG
jgi:hypothetical protein